ncbi:concanavalin A-like lectin/glucanase [Hyaloscypha variabilis]
MKFITMVLLCFHLAVTGFARTVPSMRNTQSTVPRSLTTRNGLDSTAQGYSLNWAGAIVTAPSGSSFYSVTGTLIAPDPKLPAGANTSENWYGSAWVGIDGAGPGGLFQAGISWTLPSTVKNGSYPTGPVFQAWYEWLPNPETILGNMAISAGDVITIQCQAATSSNGTCSIENQSKGTVVSKTFQSPSTSADIKGNSAEWIVEKVNYNKGNHFANFGTVEWFGCTAGLRIVPGSSVLSLLYPGDGEQVEILGSDQIPVATASTFGENMVVIYND